MADVTATNKTTTASEPVPFLDKENAQVDLQVDIVLPVMPASDFANSGLNFSSSAVLPLGKQSLPNGSDGFYLNLNGSDYVLSNMVDSGTTTLAAGIKKFNFKLGTGVFAAPGGSYGAFIEGGYTQLRKRDDGSYITENPLVDITARLTNADSVNLNFSGAVPADQWLFNWNLNLASSRTGDSPYYFKDLTFNPVTNAENEVYLSHSADLYGSIFFMSPDNWNIGNMAFQLNGQYSKNVTTNELEDDVDEQRAGVVVHVPFDRSMTYEDLLKGHAPLQVGLELGHKTSARMGDYDLDPDSNYSGSESVRLSVDESHTNLGLNIATALIPNLGSVSSKTSSTQLVLAPELAVSYDFEAEELSPFSVAAGLRFSRKYNPYASAPTFDANFDGGGVLVSKENPKIGETVDVVWRSNFKKVVVETSSGKRAVFSDSDSMSIQVTSPKTTVVITGYDNEGDAVDERVVVINAQSPTEE